MEEKNSFLGDEFFDVSQNSSLFFSFHQPLKGSVPSVNLPLSVVLTLTPCFLFLLEFEGSPHKFCVVLC